MAKFHSLPSKLLDITIYFTKNFLDRSSIPKKNLNWNLLETSKKTLGHYSKISQKVAFIWPFMPELANTFRISNVFLYQYEKYGIFIYTKETFLPDFAAQSLKRIWIMKLLIKITLVFLFNFELNATDRITKRLYKGKPIQNGTWNFVVVIKKRR